MNIQAAVLVTKGILGRAVPLASHGYLVTITDFIYVPPIKSSGRPVERIPLLEPFKHLPKLITISVMVDGTLYKRSIVVPEDMEIKTENISIKKLSNNQIKIFINQPKSI